ncbi:hypothetical protein LCGC14_2549730 [marine sediment metagenome]|uniref:Uncharacterized protein n=1 Tax=marine sediment metagenome TaxID=412755 RepID=A0A0F9CZI9_9ZZZZ
MNYRRYFVIESLISKSYWDDSSKEWRSIIYSRRYNTIQAAKYGVWKLPDSIQCGTIRIIEIFDVNKDER